MPARGDTTPPSIVAGKYLEGIQEVDAPMLIPGDGLLEPDGVGDRVLGFEPNHRSSFVSTAALVDWAKFPSPNQRPPGITVCRSCARHRAASPESWFRRSLFRQCEPTITAGTYPANVWVNLAATLKSGVLTLYVNGVQKAQTTGVVSPMIWGGDGYSGGLSIGATGFTVSDVRISRKARVPSVPTIITTNQTVVAVSTSTTGATVQPLAGGLHAFAANGSGDWHSPATAADSAQGVLGGLKTMRTDKLLTCTPIKTGGTDGTHPSAGHSGSYSYDWQVVDRSIGYIINTLGCEPYITLDSVPQILGGGVAPYSGTELTQWYAYGSSYSAGPPSSGNMAAFATMCADLVYHLRVEKGWTQCVYFDLWNEPNGSSFWETGGSAQTDYQALYALVAPAVKAISGSVKIGGPSVGVDSTSITWITGLIAYCATNSIALDFISWHHYSGQTFDINTVHNAIAAQATASSVTAPPMTVGEWGWQIGNYGYWPWTQPPAHGSIPPGYSNTGTIDMCRFDDFAAAWLGANLVLMQQLGVVRTAYCDPSPLNNPSDGLIDASGNVYAPYNVFQLWSKMNGFSVLSATVAGDPGVQAVACKDTGTGKIYVFVASLRYRKTATYPVKILLAGVANGTAVTEYLVDNAHSNRYDAGSGNGPLQTVTVPPTQGECVQVTLQPRSVALLVIG